jgi:hypothetical protein
MKVPVLWLTGPAGVGKTTAAWQVFAELTRAGMPAAFADTDQFCMCYPAPPGDPARERIKARNAGAFVTRARAAGARCVIANGVLDPELGVLHDLMPRAEVTTCRLRAAETDIVRRFRDRLPLACDPAEGLDGRLTEARALDASGFADVCIDTTGVSAHEVASLIRRACSDWPGFCGQVPAGSPPPPDVSAAGTRGRVLLLCGPTGVGKSTIGFQVYLRWLRAGLTAGYLDLEQLGFVRPAPAGDARRHQLKAGNLADMWQTYHAAGATHLIATGPIESATAMSTYARALPDAHVTLARLHAGPAELRRRIMSRREGGSWPQPGDPLRGKPAGYLRRVAAEAAADAVVLEGAGLGALRIDTDGLSVRATAELIVAGLTNAGN